MTQAQQPEVKSTVDTQCPVCKDITLGYHCEGIPCGWAKCKNKKCDAVLNFKRRLGHAINPDQSARMDPLTRVIPRLRLILVGGEWIDRDSH